MAVCSVYQRVIACSGEQCSRHWVNAPWQNSRCQEEELTLCASSIQALCLLSWGYWPYLMCLPQWFLILFIYSLVILRNLTFIIFTTLYCSLHPITVRPWYTSVSQTVLSFVFTLTVMIFSINVSLQNVNNSAVWNQDWTVTEHINACRLFPPCPQLAFGLFVDVVFF